MNGTVDRKGGRATSRRQIPDGVLAAAAAAVLVFVVRAMAIQPYNVTSGSMAPTLDRGDAVLVNRLVYRLRPPRRGDVIVFRYPQDEGWSFVKRVVGVPGDVVSARDGRLWVNGAPVTEPFAIPAGTGGGPALSVDPRRIPPGQLFVLGDNPGPSLDSRFWGPVDERNVIGSAFLVYWSRGPRWWDIRWERIGRWLP